jgi:hypothetical protein
MSRTKFWYVNCDQCGGEGTGGEGSHSHGSDLKPYMDRLRQDGWTFGARDLCAECNGNGPKHRAAACDAAKPR